MMTPARSESGAGTSLVVCAVISSTGSGRALDGDKLDRRVSVGLGSEIAVLSA